MSPKPAFGACSAESRVRELADEVIASQKCESEEMNWSISDIDRDGKAGTQAEADARPVPEFSPEDYDH